MADTVKLTLLHSNDLHGDFLPAEKNGVLTGGMARLAGYVRHARQQEQNLLYAVAGDMFHGSIIDSEYRGFSTIEMMNLLAPDVVTVGNHEVDYGMAHLLFLEKCAEFPIISANMRIAVNNKRMFRPCLRKSVGGANILFIGALTQDVLGVARHERIVGGTIDITDAAEEIALVCSSYRTADIDLTVVLSHLGLEQDRRLAEMLPAHCGVDIIIGGHSHTFMDAPELVNGVLIAQAGCGTDVLGRFDLEIDKSQNRLARWSWQCIPMTAQTAPLCPAMEELVSHYHAQTAGKYADIVTHLARTLTHPSREQETELGNLYADMLRNSAGLDFMFFGSGAVRRSELGPIITYQDLLETTPFDDALWTLEITGAQLRQMLLHILRDEAWLGETEFYQYSHGTRIRYSRTQKQLLSVQLDGEEVTDDRRIRIGMQNYHYQNFEAFLGLPLREAAANREPRIHCDSVNALFREYLSSHPGLDSHVEGRLTILD